MWYEYVYRVMRFFSQFSIDTEVIIEDNNYYRNLMRLLDLSVVKDVYVRIDGNINDYVVLSLDNGQKNISIQLTRDNLWHLTTCEGTELKKHVSLNSKELNNIKQWFKGE